jgi:hypothetical protein
MRTTDPTRNKLLNKKGGYNLKLVIDNIEDLGLEFTALDDRGGPPPLYPIASKSLMEAILNHPQPNNEHRYAIEKTMEFSKRCFQSPYNLDNSSNNDNNRYMYPSDNKAKAKANNNNVSEELLELICKGHDEGYPFVPNELIYGISKNKIIPKKRDVDLRKFELAEEGKTEGNVINIHVIFVVVIYTNYNHNIGGTKTDDGENKNEEDDEDNDNIEIEQDELEMDDDYIVDHNESEDDDDNDNEATY